MVFEVRNSALYSHQLSRSTLTPLVYRMPSARVTDSTCTTSAPSAASIADADGPAHHAVRSTTFTPARGSSAGWVAGALGGRATTVSVCSPRRGNGRGGGDPSPSIFHERRGTRKVPVGSSTSEPRATACSNATTAGPSDTGATGIRSSAANATTSAVVCLVVKSWMMPFHSSQFTMRLTMGAHSPPSMRSGRSIISRKLSNWVRVLVLKPTYPSEVGSIDGVSKLRPGLPGFGRPRSESMRSAAVVPVVLATSDIERSTSSPGPPWRTTLVAASAATAA